jgi:hypothetical protein
MTHTLFPLAPPFAGQYRQLSFFFFPPASSDIMYILDVSTFMHGFVSTGEKKKEVAVDAEPSGTFDSTVNKSDLRCAYLKRRGPWYDLACRHYFMQR